MQPDLARYARQTAFEPIGVEGQRRLLRSRVTLVGCGALGSALASTLVRAGVGFLRLIDRDFLELDNLQRQTLFDEDDLAADLPKAEAAARKLRRINSAVTVEPVVADFNSSNAEGLCRDAHLLLDGTDNLETRYLLNDVAVKRRVPWVHGACLAAEGRVLPILPGETPCFRCLWDEPPPPGALPTCETVGVLGPVVQMVAAFQALAAMRLLIGQGERLNRNLLVIDAWAGGVREIRVQRAYDEGDCRCCKHGQFDFLAGGQVAGTATLCGRQAVQVTPPPGTSVDLAALAARLSRDAHPAGNAFLLRFTAGGHRITLFPDGRAIIQGTNDPAVAKSVYAKYIGV